MADRAPRPLRAGVVGFGAIGRRVSDLLSHTLSGDVQLVGVVARTTGVAPFTALTLEQAMQECDLLVEAAGHSFVTDRAEEVLRAGVDLLVVSIGALADPALETRLRAARPGRLFFAEGAVSGLSLLTAADALAPFERIALTTTKRPAALVQPWMDEAMATRLQQGGAAIEVFRGWAREAATRFPRSMNVAATIAIAVNGWDRVEVVLRGDPAAELTRHTIEAVGPAGRYRFEIENMPDAANPATSAVVAFNVARAVAVLGGRGGQIV